MCGAKIPKDRIAKKWGTATCKNCQRVERVFLMNVIYTAMKNIYIENLRKGFEGMFTEKA